VTRAEASPTSPSVFEAEIVLSRDRSFPDGPGELVFDWAVSKGYALLEMSRHRLSLEEIFVQLTQEGGRK
jgi:hypothetical protein